jgi:hypothetical protein
MIELGPVYTVGNYENDLAASSVSAVKQLGGGEYRVIESLSGSAP